MNGPMSDAYMENVMSYISFVEMPSNQNGNDTVCEILKQLHKVWYAEYKLTV